MDQRHAIKSIDKSSIHKITSGQVVIDLQTAVKELVENSLDAGATSIEVRFKNYGLRVVEVIDNGTGIAEEYHENIALKHYTSKLSSFDDLTTIQTFGFRGEALSSLCALSESLSVVTATEPPLGTQLEMGITGKVKKRNKIARQRGTTVTVSNLFSPLPVRRKELERNIKREFGKALTLLNAYALGPCCNKGSGIKLTVTNQPDKGPKTVQLQTAGASSCRLAVSALWSSKALENIVDLQLSFDVERERSSLKRLKTLQTNDTDPTPVIVKGLISKFTVSAGRNGTDRQFFYVNGRPCNLPKIQKAFNEVYRSFNANQSPFILADFVVPTDSCDINVSPDKRTIFLQSESNLISALKATLEQAFASARSTFDVKQSQSTQSTLSLALKPRRVSTPTPAAEGAGDADEDDGRPESPQVPSEDTNTTKASSIAASSSSSTGLSLPFSEKVKKGPSTSSSPIHHKAPSKAAEPLFLADPEGEDSYEIGEKVKRDKEDVDNNEMDEEETVEVLDTSQASWSQHITSPPAPVAGAVNAQVCSSLDEDITMVADDEEQECEKASPSKPRIIAKPIEEEPESPSLPPSLPPITVLEPRSSISPLLDMPRIVHKGIGSAPTSAIAGKPTCSARAGDARKPIQRKLTDFAGPGRRNIPKAVQDPVADENEEDDDELNPDSATSSKTVSVRRSPSPEEEGVEQTQYTSGAQNTSSVSSAILLGDTRVDDNDEDMEGPQITPIFDPVRDTSSALRAEEPVTRPEVIRAQSNGAGDVSLRFNLAKVKTTWMNMERQVTPVGQVSDREASASSFPSAAGLANTDDNAQATEALARVIEKQDFDNMDILGQFNLGFIITRRRKHGNNQEICSRLMDDLFIVDQHAADEKYNFETLQATTKIKSQKLFQPQSLELTAADELVATENLDVLHQNGFEVEIEDQGNHVAGSKLKLVAQPTSKSTIFNMKDLEELIHLMRDGPSGQMVRCSKARAMFAMRACRKSVMIGMPLKKHQMTQVVQHMGSMDLPWNCPHGRPTMRHLFDLSNHPSHRSKPINWDGLT